MKLPEFGGGEMQVGGATPQMRQGPAHGRLGPPEWASDSSGFPDGHLIHFGMGI